MAKKVKGHKFTAWPFKPVTGLTMPARLGKYKYPLPMVGNSRFTYRSSNAWHRYSQDVYDEMMVAKRGGWSNATYQQAWEDNETFDENIARKWADYELAWLEHANWVYEEAQLENFNLDYNREYIAA